MAVIFGISNADDRSGELVGDGGDALVLLMPVLADEHVLPSGLRRDRVEGKVPSLILKETSPEVVVSCEVVPACADLRDGHEIVVIQKRKDAQELVVLELCDMASNRGR